MQPYTGHLMNTTELPTSRMAELMQMGYEPVPKELQSAASKKLAGKSEVTVSLTSGGKLSRWAAGKRKEKQQRKAVKESRRRNRK
ncbi:MAG: hypothetical protein WA118_08150 [Carboxydocellales bacterium]